ncbi:DNA ligase 1-like [Pseudorasbora parva]|uniref:DNA ligase 1-like n=1 Tax=Pseudorasbora parva TaxID=51549 RepID=UPI00351DC414
MSLSPINLLDKITWSDVRKKKMCPDKIIWPVAPDGYIPNSVVRSFAPYPKFSRPTYCANKELHLIAQVNEDKTLKLKKRFNYLLKEQFIPKEVQQNEEVNKDGLEQNEEDQKDGLEHGIQSVHEEADMGASLQPLQSDVSVETKTEAKFAFQRGLAQRQYSLQNRQKLLQQNATSAEELQNNASSLEKVQMNASPDEELQTNATSVNKLQTNTTSVEELQTNATSLDELKSEDDGEKDFSHHRKEKSSASHTKQKKKVKKGHKASFKLSEDLSLSPSLQQEKEKLQHEIDELQQEKEKLQQEKDDLQKEIASSIKEAKKSFQESRRVPGVGDPIQNRRRKKTFSLKKLKSFVPALLPMRDRRPGSLLMYLYKRSKAESSPSED